MFYGRLIEVSSRVLLVAVLVSASLGLSACSGTQELPEGAREALEEYWKSLRSHPGVENRIVRAWPGEATADGSTLGAPLMETWCVEAAMSSTGEPSVDGELVWIVMRENDETRWSAALLASMSSIWPYQACGEVPSS